MKRALLILIVNLAIAATASAQNSPDPAEFSAQPNASKLFARIKALAGKWSERSTKGWEGSTVVRVIARGSAVMMTNEFSDEPGEGMATMFFVDKDKLAVTHFCEAGNQPTLVARGVSADGNRILFTLENATGLDTPGEGRMDKLILTLADGDRYSEQWTFSRDGRENWMEVIELRRVATSAGQQ